MEDDQVVTICSRAVPWPLARITRPSGPDTLQPIDAGTVPVDRTQRMTRRKGVSPVQSGVKNILRDGNGSWSLLATTEPMSGLPCGYRSTLRRAHGERIAHTKWQRITLRRRRMGIDPVFSASGDGSPVRRAGQRVRSISSNSLASDGGHSDSVTDRRTLPEPGRSRGRSGRLRVQSARSGEDGSPFGRNHSRREARPEAVRKSTGFVTSCFRCFVV